MGHNRGHGKGLPLVAQSIIPEREGSVTVPISEAPNFGLAEKGSLLLGKGQPHEQSNLVHGGNRHLPLLQILDGNGRALGGGHKSLIGQASHAHESLLGLDLSVPRRHLAEKVLKGLWRENVLAQDWVLSLGGTHGCKQLV